MALVQAASLSTLLSTINGTGANVRDFVKAWHLPGTSKGSLQNILWKRCEAVHKIASTLIGAAKGGDKLRIGAVVVNHGVNGTTRENGHPHGSQILGDHPGTVFFDHIYIS